MVVENLTLVIVITFAAAALRDQPCLTGARALDQGVGENMAITSEAVHHRDA